MQVIRLPRKLDTPKAFIFINYAKMYLNEDIIYIDFKLLDFAYTFAILYIGVELQEIVSYRISKGLKTNAKNYLNGRNVLSYLQHIGFYKFIGLDIGYEPGEATGSNTYTPITIFKREDFEIQGELDYSNIEKCSRYLTKIVLNNPNPAINHPMTYCFRELIRNVFEHSQANSCFLCAQKWMDKTTEIAVIDKGRGIRNSLEEKYEFEDNYKALRKAIMPGITRNEISEHREDGYHNTGYGLYVLSRLSLLTGHFYLCSGENAIHGTRLGYRKLEQEFNGTAICLRMVKPEGIAVRELLNRIVAKGEEISKEKGRTHSASERSKSF